MQLVVAMVIGGGNRAGDGDCGSEDDGDIYIMVECMSQKSDPQLDC